jgi:hypothetical protein
VEDAIVVEVAKGWGRRFEEARRRVVGGEKLGGGIVRPDHIID